MPLNLQRTIGLSDENYLVLTDISHAFKRTSGQQKQGNLPVRFRDELKRRLGGKAFARFDRMLKEKIIFGFTMTTTLTQTTRRF
jgi:hypothetical protein